MSDQKDSLYNNDNNSVKGKEKFGRDKIDTGQAKFMDSLVNVNKLYNNLESSLQHFSSLKPNTNRRVKGLGNLEPLNLGSSILSFTVDNMKDKGTIFATDPNGDVITFSKNSWWMKHNANRGLVWFFNTEDKIDQFLNLPPDRKNVKEKLCR